MNTYNVSDHSAQEINTKKNRPFVLFQDHVLTLTLSKNNENGAIALPYAVKQGRVSFYFCLKGRLTFEFTDSDKRDLGAQMSSFLYEPRKDLAFTLCQSPESHAVILEISLEQLHKLFVQMELPFGQITQENQRQFLGEQPKPINSRTLMALHQIVSFAANEENAKLYYQGKVLEVLALYFAKSKSNYDTCPFLNTNNGLRKLKQAREYLTAYFAEPITLRKLSKIAGMNEYQLKVGFLEYYGQTVHAYLIDYRLEQARRLLESGDTAIAEAAERVGYANVSHFIAAFKKKFGATPKQYILHFTQ